MIEWFKRFGKALYFSVSLVFLPAIVFFVTVSLTQTWNTKEIDFVKKIQASDKAFLERKIDTIGSQNLNFQSTLIVELGKIRQALGRIEGNTKILVKPKGEEE